MPVANPTCWSTQKGQGRAGPWSRQVDVRNAFGVVTGGMSRFGDQKEMLPERLLSNRLAVNGPLLLGLVDCQSLWVEGGHSNYLLRLDGERRAIQTSYVDGLAGLPSRPFKALLLVPSSPARDPSTGSPA